MADTRNDVTIPKGVWVDLFAGSGVTVGTVCTIYNKGSNPIFVSVSATAPAVPTTGSPKGVPLYVGGSPETRITMPTGTSGLWGYCVNNGGGLVLVQD